MTNWGIDNLFCDVIHGRFLIHHMKGNTMKKLDMTEAQQEQVLVEYIRIHANANYTQGWDEVVECWEDGDILEVLSEVDFDLPKAIAAIQSVVDVLNERKADARNSVF